jgi:hypothetical protein
MFKKTTNVLMFVFCFFGGFSAKAGDFSVGLNYGLVFTDPSELNSVIDLYNSAFGASAKKIGTAARFGLYTDYSLNESWSVGVSYGRMSPWTEASVTTGGVTASGRYETYTNLFGIRAKHIFYRENKISVFVLPTLGLASYTVDGTVGSSGVNQLVSASTTGLFVAIGLGGLVQFTDTLGVSFDTGYQYAKSGALTVDSQSNTSLSTGSDYIVSGNRVKLDSSGFYVNLGLQFSFQGSASDRGAN